jgi:hypothetical protein
MAGNTLEELFKGVGLEQGTVKAERHGRSAGSIIDKIKNKCKPDIEVLDEAIKKGEWRYTNNNQKQDRQGI